MSSKIKISAMLHQYTNGQSVAEVSGSTVGQCLDHLVKQFPGINEGLFDKNGKLHSYYDVYVNGKSAFPEELTKPVKDGDELHLVSVIGGG